jgi:hypothetical protein
MVQSCHLCRRSNPDEAKYCHHDGSILIGHQPGKTLHTSLRPFPHPLSFPSGQPCLNFEQLLLCCQDDWATATRLLRQGDLERFFITLGRLDLARIAHAAATSADLDRSLDELLGRLPSQKLQVPRLRVTPQTLELENLRPGEDRRLDVTLRNEGIRLLYGSVTSNRVWLTLGDTGAAEKVFQFSREQTLVLWVRGLNLSASHRSREARLTIESNGGGATVVVRVKVPPQPFMHGVLAGAESPRQLVDKVRLDPRAASELFDCGAVADWYRRNGWPYPVVGPLAAGLDGVRQFFKGLGLPDELDVVELTSSILPTVGSVRPFDEGVLAGAINQGQLVEKARTMPVEAAQLFESGAVAAWYEQNGWVYPVQGPRALGVDAVYQFLKIVEGNSAPLAVVVKPTQKTDPPTVARTTESAGDNPEKCVIHLRGHVGERLKRVLSAKPKKGAALLHAHASSDQPWLDIGATKFDDAGTTIVLVVPMVPDCPGETLRARVHVTVNDAQSYIVPVILSVGEKPTDALGSVTLVSS